MKWQIRKPREFISVAWSSFKLKKYEPAPQTLQVLRDLYPTVNWNRVDFYEGLPWFTPVVAPYVTAQALPQFYSFSRYRIYLRHFDERRAQCIADIVHEAFHILQAMKFMNGYGVGFFRGWMVYYISCFIRHGYRNNPFEIPAYDQEYRFLDYCAKHNISGIQPPIPENAFDTVGSFPALVHRTAEFKFREGPILLLGGILFCLVVTLIKPVADLLLFLIGQLFFRRR